MNHKHTSSSSPHTYQSDCISSFLEGFHGGGMGHIHNWCIVHLQYGIVHLQPTINGCRTARYKFRDVNGGVIANMWIVCAPGDTEAQTGTTSLQYDLLVFPFIITIYLKKKKYM